MVRMFCSLRLHLLFAYGAALALVGALTLALRGFAVVGPPHLPLLVFIVAVMCAAAVGGPGPALFAAVLGALSTDYFLVAPPQSFKLTHTVSDAVAFAAFAGATVLTSLACRVRSQSAVWRSEVQAMSSRLDAEARRQELLLELSVRALAGGSLDALCRDAATMTTSALDMAYCFVFELAPGAESLAVKATAGSKPGAFETLTIDADIDTQVGYALHVGEPVVVRDTDASSDMRFALPVPLRAQGVRSGIATRIGGPTRAFGVVAAYDTSPRTPSAGEAHFIAGVSAVLAGVYERKRLESERAELLARDAAHRNATEMLSRRATFLAQTSTVLDAALEPEATLVNLARLAVPALADGAVVDLVQEDGHVRRVDVVDIDPTRRETTETLRRLSPDLRGEDIFARAIRTGQSVAVSESPESGSSADAEHQRLMRALQWQSTLSIPLVARGQTLGLITLASREPDRLCGPQGLSLAQELAGRAAIALDNARLYREAQSASRAKDEFLATVSHELRTPVNAVLGWATILRDHKADEARAQSACDAIERNARAQAQLVEQLLDVSRIISGKLELHLAPMHLRDIVEASIDSIRPTADEKNIRIASAVDGSVPVAMVDPDRLQQALVNVVANAIKFTPDGGVVRVDLYTVDAFAEIVVSDNGVGIKREFLPYVFDRLRQGHAPTSKGAQGLGLGLSIVRDIVERHGGRVSAESAGEGKGAVFTLRVPLRAVPGPAMTDNRASLGIAASAIMDDPAALPAWSVSESAQA